MTTTNTKKAKFALDELVLQLEIDREGRIIRRTRSMVQGEGKLENTLLSALYPDIRVATVNIPKQMEMHEEVRVHETMANFRHKGVQYTLAGASGSAKEGKFYFVDQKYRQAVARRFHNWPEAAMVYFGMLVSPCEAMIQEDDVRVLVVPDHTLGTNDCRGWIKRSLAKKLDLPETRLYQFRIAFQDAQGKGCFKVMEDDVADALEADVILPESSLKPGLKVEDGDSQALRTLKTIVPVARSIFTPWTQAQPQKRKTQESFSIFSPDRRFRGRTVIGVREVSRELEFGSSYQLTQFAPHDSIQLEILPETLAGIRKLTEAVTEGHYEELMELLGSVPIASLPSDLEQEVDDDPEYDVVRALLMADATGVMVRYPYIKNRLNELLARWAFKTSTGGGYRLPAFMLADDGYLILVDGTIYCGSDWIPRGKTIVAGHPTFGLVVRYPIRMFEDLLPVANTSDLELRNLLAERFRKQGRQLPQPALDNLIERQLRLEGTLVLHSQTAVLNGGDFDGDWCGLMCQERFPRFVERRFMLKNEFQQTKLKLEKKKSNPLNSEAVALAAVGNWIGSITDLITTCIAAGREDRAYQLVAELQKALDSLKHQVKPNLELVNEIRKEVGHAPWLRLKNVRKISQLPDHLEVDPTDRIGELYNLVRSEIGEFFIGETSIKDFKGLVLGSSPTREMLEECSRVNAVFAMVIGSISRRAEPIQKQLDQAKAELEAALKAAEEDATPEHKELVKQKRKARNLADDAFYQNRERTKDEMKALLSHIQLWAAGKTENREAWCQALHRVVSNGEGTGFILVFAFPQELVNKVAERTGGNPVRVRLPRLCEGFVHVDPDGRAFLVEPIKTGPNQAGVKRSYLFTCKDGKYSTEEIPDQELASEEATTLEQDLDKEQ